MHLMFAASEFMDEYFVVKLKDYMVIKNTCEFCSAEIFLFVLISVELLSALKPIIWQNSPFSQKSREQHL